MSNGLVSIVPNSLSVVTKYCITQEVIKIDLVTKGIHTDIHFPFQTF